MDLCPKDVIFTTQQTDSVFILTSHLKGYERTDIKIEINEDGSRLTISCKHLEIARGFHKTFKIPEGVVLDKVKARFDQDESRLTIRMPKSVKGLVTGTGIQELETMDLKETNIIQSENQVDKTQDQEETKQVSIIYSPIIAGSALFVSLIVVVLSLVRSKNQKRNY